MAVESAIFWEKSPHKFSETDPSNLIIADYAHFEQAFSLQNQNQPISPHYTPFVLYFKFHHI